MNRTSVGFKTSFHPDSYWTSSGLRKKWVSVPYMGFYDVLYACSDGGVSEHAQDVLLIYAHAYSVGGSEHAHWWLFCEHTHYVC